MKLLGACLDSDAPCFVPVQALLVEKDAHEFRYSNGGMGVIHLKDCLVRQLLQVAVALLESRHHILQASH